MSITTLNSCAFCPYISKETRKCNVAANVFFAHLNSHVGGNNTIHSLFCPPVVKRECVGENQYKKKPLSTDCDTIATLIINYVS